MQQIDCINHKSRSVMRREAEQREEPMQHNTSKALDALSIVQKDEEEREPMDSVGYEEYRLVLSHDLVIGDTRIKLNNPIVTKYIVLRDYRFQNMVPNLINEMMEKMKNYLLAKIGGAW